VLSALAFPAVETEQSRSEAGLGRATPSGAAPAAMHSKNTVCLSEVIRGSRVAPLFLYTPTKDGFGRRLVTSGMSADSVNHILTILATAARESRALSQLTQQPKVFGAKFSLGDIGRIFSIEIQNFKL